MDSKGKYRSFCEQNLHLPLFVQPWYLDTVCADGQWEVVLAEEAGRIVAALPYFLKKKGPFRYITMPLFCKFMGPFFAAGINDAYKQQKLMKKLVAGLPKVDSFYQQFHYDCQNWLPFFWSGFRQQTLYSYRLENIQNLEAIYAGLSADYRNQKIQKAAAELYWEIGEDVEAFFTLSRKSFTRQNLEIPFSREFLGRFFQQIRQWNAGRLFFARDQATGHLHSAACLVWDRQSAYLLIAGDDPEFRKSGSGIWLTWELIRYASEELGLEQFDFLGSMIEPIERVRRQFGAVQQPYHSVWKHPSKWFGALKWLSGATAKYKKQN